MSYANSITIRIWKPVDNTPLILFRILLGFLLLFQSINDMLSDRVRTLFVEPVFTFPFIGFEWLQPLPGNGMYIYFLGMALFACMIMLGAFYRIGIIGYTLLWTATYLMQKCGYNNHYYLIVLIGALMCCVPANRRLSVDAWRNPALFDNSCPQWCTWIFIVQFGIVYTYAALNKLYPDWLSGRYLMSSLTWSWLRTPVIVYFLAYGGILFDLLVTPLMLWKRTRNYAFAAACFFHLTNACIFTIGIFPFLALSSMLFFFPPQVLRRLLHWKAYPMPRREYELTVWRKVVTGMIGIYLVIQLLLPLRYLLWGTQPWWSEEGFRMSWRMMLRNKRGWIYFKISDPATHKTWIDEPDQRLNYASLNSLAGFPDLIWQYAQRLKKIYAAQGYRDVEIHAIGAVSLNGRHMQPIVDPAADLAHIPWEPFKHATWIMPLEEE